jgi:hypothetical protein
MAKKAAKKPARKASKPVKKSASTASKKSVKKTSKKSPSTRGGSPAYMTPKPVSTGKGASVAEIGAAVVDTINNGKSDLALWDKYWSNAVESIEGMGVSMLWSGRKAMEGKSAHWMSTHTIHGATAEGPFLGATGFAVKFRMDVTDNEKNQRFTMDEVGVYTVKKGKVVREEFMYGNVTNLPPA